jgi:hypothetical protein
MAEKKGISPEIIAALIGVAGTIAVAVLFNNNQSSAPDPATPAPIVITATFEPTAVPTDTVPPGDPTSTPEPTDTPEPTPTEISPVAIGQDWAQGCISSLWVPYSSDGPVDVLDGLDGCFLQPVAGFEAAGGKLSFLYDARLSSAEVHGMFAPLPSVNGTVSVFVRLKELTKSDIWIGVFADPSIDSAGLLMTIPAGKDLSSSPFAEWTMPGLEKITTTGIVNQGNGYGVKFEYTAGSVKAVVLPNVTATKLIPVTASQKYLFIGYKGVNGTNRIDASFFDLVVTEQ